MSIVKKEFAIFVVEGKRGVKYVFFKILGQNF
jgi:hypothetical protein